MAEGVQKLEVYHAAMDLVEETYRLTRLLPRSEQFALIPQMQRAATSIPMNIAEGYGRRHRGDYVRSLSIARGSVFELETQVEIALRLKYANPGDAAPSMELIDKVKRMLTRLINRLAEQGPT